VYKRAGAFGGPGRFGFNEKSFMDEHHPLATAENAERLFREWSTYWDLRKQYLIEKSPPNLVRTRFLQQLFPTCKFIIILRHPVAIAYATKKWSKTTIPSLIEHSLRCYERFGSDLPFLRSVYVLRYEEFVQTPQLTIQNLLAWIGVESFVVRQDIRNNINEKYFAIWDRDRRSIWKKFRDGFIGVSKKFEKRSNAFGYSIETPTRLLPIEWLGPDLRYSRPAFSTVPLNVKARL
jgi:hypothetical protein